jgi:hypothetical protein
MPQRSASASADCTIPSAPSVMRPIAGCSSAAMPRALARRRSEAGGRAGTSRPATERTVATRQAESPIHAGSAPASTSAADAVTASATPASSTSSFRPIRIGARVTSATAPTIAARLNWFDPTTTPAPTAPLP